MESSNTWINQFNVSPAQLDAWKLEAPAGAPLIFWCLIEAKIPLKDYVEWAKNQYGLAVLRPDFFENSSIFQIKNSVDSSSWHPWEVPLSQWDGVTFVGCVEPPSSPQPNCQYILAPPVELNEFFKQLFPVIGHELSSLTEMAPEGLNLEITGVAMEAPQGLNLNLHSEPPPFPQMPNDAPEEVETKSLPPQENFGFEQTSVTTLGTSPPDLSQWWQEAKNIFANALILSGDAKELQMVWRNGEVVQGPQISLASPSLFRIALRTQKPYHGFVIKNEIHKTFFSAIGESEFPKPITAVAKKIDDNQFLVIVCYGFLGSDQSQELDSAQDLSERFNEPFTTYTTTKQSA